MFEVSSMAPESFIEWCFRSTKISFVFILGFIRDLCFIRDLYKVFGAKHLLSKGHSSLTLQLHPKKIFFVEIQTLFVV